MVTKLVNDIFQIKDENSFKEVALSIFQFQAANNTVYRDYLKYLGKDPLSITEIKQIPFLPIEFFKSHKVASTKETEKVIFTSSGTTGDNTSKHYVPNLDIYIDSFVKGFEAYYGKVSDYCILALLPSYLEREGSSLIFMMEELIKISTHNDSGFYLHNIDELKTKLHSLEEKGTKTLLLGVSFALLDMARNHKLNLKNTIVMETGGMKGRDKELTKKELHNILCTGFGVDKIHSEYGMTELLSQAYSKGENIFYTPKWMKILIRDTYDPFCYLENGKSGGINVIDLANIYSCSFIETKDLGKINADGGFEALGRFDQSDIRGCNLLLSE